MSKSPQRCSHCGAMNSARAIQCKQCHRHLGFTAAPSPEPLESVPAHDSREASSVMERPRAKKWYAWLWLSPLLTVPTFALIYKVTDDPGYELICGDLVDCRSSRWLGYTVAVLVAVLGSALWHLILLVPARDREAAFVRWHGRQALLLAGVRTALALAVGLTYATDSFMLLPASLLLLVWLGGTIWGQNQARRGDSSLMRWAGHEEELWALQRAEKEADTEEPDLGRLAEIIRYSSDPEARRKALSELEKLGMVDPL